MSFYTDLPAAVPALSIFSNTGAEKASFEAGSYYFSDIVGGDASRGPLLSGGTGLSASSTSLPLVPGGYSLADMALHPGVMWVSTAAGGSSQHCIMSSQNDASQQGIGVEIYPNGLAMKSTIIFKTPLTTVLADRYAMIVGPCNGPISGILSASNGFALGVDTSNNNWQTLEFRAGGLITMTTSSVQTVANTWYRLDTYINFQPNRVTMTVTPCGTNNTVTTCNNVLSSNLNSGFVMSAGGAGMAFRRIASTGIELGAIIDYWSFTTYAPGRQW